MEGGRALAGDVGMAGGKSWVGERSGPEALDGWRNALGTGGGPRGMDGAGRNHPEPSKRCRARTAVAGWSPADSDRPRAHSEMVQMECVCSTHPSWVEALSGGGGGGGCGCDAVRRGVRTNASPTRSRIARAPGSVPEGNRVGEGRTEGGSGSHPGNWNAQTAAGAGGEEVAGKEGASGALRLEADREHSSARA